MKIILSVFLLSASLHGQWMTGFYAAQNGVLPVSNIPWTKYSHIIHFAAAPNANGTIDMHYLVQTEINAFASRPAGKKVLVAIKDQDSNLSAFSSATSPSVIATFVNNIVNFVNSNGYDGLDIDWEANVNVTQFNDLISRLRAAMPAKIIVMDGGDWNGMNNVAATSQSKLDQINVMCYDMDNGQNCNGQECTWHNDALFQNGQSDKRTCDNRVRAFTSLGVAPGKIGIGMPFYARRRTGTTQEMMLGNFPSYTLNYRDLVSDSSRWQTAYKKYDSGFKADYLSIPSLNEFISYNGTQSFTDAVAWQKSQGFGGFMTFAIDQEYLPGQSGDAAYPMSTTLYNLLFGGSAPPPPSGGTAEPVRSGGSPTGTLASSTVTATLSLITNVNSTCAYSTLPGVAYSLMPFIFSTTGGTAHSTTVVSLLPGTTYNYYVRCSSGGTANTSDYPISFSIASQSTSTGPVPFLVTPSSGTGSTQSFTFQVSDPGGWAAVQQLDPIFDTVVSKTNSCWVEYWAPTRMISLKNDDNINWTQAAMGSFTVLRNSQCSVNPAASSAGGSGTTMTLTLAMSFTNNYSGTKSIIAFAGDTAGLGSGWQTIGSWTVPWMATTQSTTAPVMTLSPNTGSGSSPTFTMQVTDAAGAAAVTQADLFIGTAVGAANSCWFEYNPPNILTLRTDNNGGYTQGTIGSSNQLKNGQCTVDLRGASVTQSGNILTVKVPTQFQNRFKATNQLFTFAADATLSTGWQNMGTWTR